MLIRRAEIHGQGRIADVRISGGRIIALGDIAPEPGEPAIDAGGRLLLPGLHDHHLHLNALAAQRDSVPCGPPEVTDIAALNQALSRLGDGWLRGTGYHEAVAGLPDAALLDSMAPDRPVRIQHRSGRMWFLNSAALDRLLGSGLPPPPGLERIDGRYTGRLFDADSWLRAALGSAPPPLEPVSRSLAARGITGVTEMTPDNDPAAAVHLASQQDSGALLQRCIMAGSLALADAAATPHLAIGPAKIHLHEAELTPLDALAHFIASAHAQGRAVAIHCVSEVELVYALAALREGGSAQGDRIEHASVAPDHLVAEIAAMGLAVVTQPHFIHERGDQYRALVDPDAVPDLYRLRAFLDAGIVLAGGSDGPFGQIDPWAAMAAAVSRTTRAGMVMGPQEALRPEEALALWLADPHDLARQRPIASGAPADLCLIDRSWDQARSDLGSVDVLLTMVDGRIIHDGIDQSPIERSAGTDPAD